MGNRIDVVIYCRKGKHRYQATFEEQAPAKWYGVAAKALEPITLFEKMKLKKEHTNVSIYKSKMMQNPLGSADGTFYSGSLMCPNCGCTSFVKCSKCGELTCHPLGGSTFKCAVCGNEGNVSGHIKSMSGSTSGNSKGGAKKW